MPGETIDIFAEATDTDNGRLNYTFTVTTAHEGILQYYVNEEVPIKFIGGGANVKLIAPNAEGLYRVYIFVSDGKGNVATANKSIKVGQ